jgi:hypothetical protein
MILDDFQCWQAELGSYVHYLRVRWGDFNRPQARGRRSLGGLWRWEGWEVEPRRRRNWIPEMRDGGYTARGRP